MFELGLETHTFTSIRKVSEDWEAGDCGDHQRDLHRGQGAEHQAERGSGGDAGFHGPAAGAARDTTAGPGLPGAAGVV